MHLAGHPRADRRRHGRHWTGRHGQGRAPDLHDEDGVEHHLRHLRRAARLPRRASRDSWRRSAKRISASRRFSWANWRTSKKKRDADRKRVEAFKTLCKPLAKIFNQDENAVSDYIIWVGSDSQLAGRAGNAKFFDDANPVGFRATTTRIQEFFVGLGLIESAIDHRLQPARVDGAFRRWRDCCHRTAKPTPPPTVGRSPRSPRPRRCAKPPTARAQT